jgi:putative ABC transport system permease protein
MPDWSKELESRLASLRLSPPREKEIIDELSEHLELRYAELCERGIHEADAFALARDELLDDKTLAESLRPLRQAHVPQVPSRRLPTSVIAGIAGGCRDAVRTLSRIPGFTLTVVITLAMAIGGNVAVFSALDAVLLEPLPFPSAERLVYVRQTVRDVITNSVGPLRLEDWNERSTTFDSFTGYSPEDVADTSGDFGERRRLARVAPRFFESWGLHPVAGRGFAQADHQPGATPLVVISARYWKYRFGSDPGVLGSVVRLGNESFEVAGVADDRFAFVDPDIDFWVPMIYQPDFNRRSAWYTGYARIKDGVTTDQARADLARVQAALAKEYPESDRDIGVVIESLEDARFGNVRGSLWLLYASVTVLLVIACTNTAALLLARGSQRRHDMAIRRALGASHLSLVAQTLSETFVLVVCGSIVGLAIASAATRGFRRVAVGLPRVDQISIDFGVVLYTLAVVLVVTMLCGVLPALRSIGGGMGGRSTMGGTRWQVSSRHSAQWLLVGAQVTLSVILLTGAGLLARSLYEISRVEPGFDMENVLTFRITGNFGEPVPIAQTVEGVLAEVAALPAINSVAVSSPVPGVSNDRSGFDFNTAAYRLSSEERSRGNAENEMPAVTRIVSPGYFEVMKIPLVEGQRCTRSARGEYQDVAVNQRFARQYFTNRSPLGETIVSPRGDALRIVAVYSDAREYGVALDPVPTVYDCRTAVAYPPLAFTIRTNGDPEQVINSIRQSVKRVEPARALYDVSTLEARVSTEYGSERLRTSLVGLFAAVALALVAVGVYSTVAYIVSLRYREIGLRMAIGARRSDIFRHYVGKALRVVAIAASLGLVGSLAASRALSNMLFAVSAWDPLTFSTVIAVVILVAAWAALSPSLKASRVDPMVALREDG